MHYFMNLLVVFCFFVPIATLRNCSDAMHHSLQLCVTGSKEDYVKPFPVMVESNVNLKNIVDIDLNKKFIKVRVFLWTSWIDPRLSLSNATIE